MIEHIEELRTELQRTTFAEAKALGETQIEVEGARPAQDSYSRCAKRLRSRVERHKSIGIEPAIRCAVGTSEGQGCR